MRGMDKIENNWIHHKEYLKIYSDIKIKYTSIEERAEEKWTTEEIIQKFGFPPPTGVSIFLHTQTVDKILYYRELIKKEDLCDVRFLNNKRKNPYKDRFELHYENNKDDKDKEELIVPTHDISEASFYINVKLSMNGHTAFYAEFSFYSEAEECIIYMTDIMII